MFTTYFKPRNIKFLKNFRLRLKAASVQRHLVARRAHLNSFILRKHVDSKLTVLIGNARRILYGRHIFLCYFLSSLFYRSVNYVIGQGLVSKTTGFQNLRYFFAGQQLSSFLLARKDISYLRSYGQIFSDLAYLLRGGYTFLAHVPERKLSFVNFFKSLTMSPNPMLDGTVRFVRFYPLFFRVAQIFMYPDLFYQRIKATCAKYEKLGLLQSAENFLLDGGRKLLPISTMMENWLASTVPSFYNSRFSGKFLALLYDFREKLSISN